MNTRPPISSEKINTPLFILGILFILTIGTSIIPASWFGIQAPARQYAPLNLGNIAQPENIADDADGNGSISWKELISSSLGLSEAEGNAQFETDPQGIAILNDENNLTASFTKNAYIASSALKDSGILDEGTKQEIITQLIQEEVQKIKPYTYSSADITVVADNKTSIKTYGNGVVSIMKGLITENSIVKDLASMNRYLGTADESNLLHLVQAGSKADAVLIKLAAMQVPSSAVSHHVTLLNRVGEHRDVLLNMSAAHTDAMRATIATKKYQDSILSTLQMYPILADYFAAKNVTFSSSEPGYVYIVGYTGKSD